MIYKGKRLGAMSILLIILILCVSACGTTEEYGEEYHEGSDYQYMLVDKGLSWERTKVRGNNGYFILQGHYIYYMADGTQNLVPLCSKPDCMHNEETDSERYTDCNGYFYSANSLSYCNGYIYVLDNEVSVEKLYRISEDGSQKEIVVEWDVEDAYIGNWMVHRDVLYYVEIRNYVVDEEVFQDYSVMRKNLSGNLKKKPAAIYKNPEDITIFSFGEISAYADYVYFFVIGYPEEDAGSVEEDGYEEYYLKLFAYNIQKGNLSEIACPEVDTAYFSGVTFWDGRIILPVSDYGKTLGDEVNVYIADLDGTNMELFMDNGVYGNYYASDGTYLYIFNYALTLQGIENMESFWVYDSGMNLVDTFRVPFDTAWSTDVGMDDGIYFWTYSADDIDENGNSTLMKLMYFDKGAIGTLDGAEFTYSEVATWEQSPADKED